MKFGTEIPMWLGEVTQTSFSSLALLSNGYKWHIT